MNIDIKVAVFLTAIDGFKFSLKDYLELDEFVREELNKQTRQAFPIQFEVN